MPRPLCILSCIAPFIALAYAQTDEPLRLVGTVPLPQVEGRIDHMSIDVKGQRLFVAALGNNTLEVIDVKNGNQLHSIAGLREPQGIVYLPGTNRLNVANGDDGSLRVFDGSSFELLKTIPYGDDADNVRYDSREDRIYVGYGSGALGVIGKDGNKVADIKLDAHPESFQIETAGSRIFINLPKSQKIAVVDRNTRAIIASWTTGGPLSKAGSGPLQRDRKDHDFKRSPNRIFLPRSWPALRCGQANRSTSGRDSNL
jgi:DNA-binding beta-propeller fold protein YncE